MNARRLLIAVLVLLGSAAWAQVGGVTKNNEKTVSGVIVDATSFDLSRCRFPRLYDPEGRMVYPSPKLASNRSYQGFSGYKQSLQAAREDTGKVGRNPLLLHPLKVNEGDPTCGSLDISAEDAAKLRALNESGKLLDKDQVVIVIGVSVLSHEPAADAADVPVGATIKLVFSKRLVRDCAKPGAVVLSDAEGKAVAGKLAYDDGHRTMTLQPTEALQVGQSYSVVVSAKLTALNQAQLGIDYTFTFKTAAPADTSSSEGGGGGGSQGHDTDQGTSTRRGASD